MKKFAELTKAGQEKRIAKYAAEDAKYGVKDGLFRVTRMSDHGVIDTKFGKAQNFGYYLVPVSGVDANDFKPGSFTWANQLVNVDKGQVVIDKMHELQAQLAKPEVKSVLVSVKYSQSKVGDKTYTNVNSLYIRHRTAKAAK